MPEEIYVEYIGNGVYISGIPTANMTCERWERVPQGLRDLALSKGLYKLVEKRSKASSDVEVESEE